MIREPLTNRIAPIVRGRTPRAATSIPDIRQAEAPAFEPPH